MLIAIYDQLHHIQEQTKINLLKKKNFLSKNGFIFMSGNDDNDIEYSIPEEKWIEAEGNDQEDQDSEDEYGGGMTNLFADPDPYDDFSLSFSIMSNWMCLSHSPVLLESTCFCFFHFFPVSDE